MMASMVFGFSRLTLSCRIVVPVTSTHLCVQDLLRPSKSSPLVYHQQQRDYPTSKHWLLKFRPLRRRKFLQVDIPDIQKLKSESRMTPDEMRIKLKKEGKLPPRGFEERPINLSCTGAIFDGYVSPEGDGRRSLISRDTPKETLAEVQSKRKSFMALRKMRRFEEDFDQRQFPQDAQDLYIKSQDLLADWKENEDRLHDIVTETAFPLMVHGLDMKTFRWRFIETIEPPRLVHARTSDLMSKDNLYTQITVRIHTKQTLAIYDRFGRLMYGSEHLVRDILEYVVFEKHISDIYGRWRVHGKIIPDWMPPREPMRRTYTQPTPTTGELDSTGADTVQRLKA